jgi:AcrR family transcriptional regulator
MKVKCVNHSSIKTKKLIRSEFAKMIRQKKELSKISVSELVRNIDINRCTFYSHYSSIDEVAKELQNEALDLLNENVNTLSDVESLLDKLNLFLKDNYELYSAILKANDPMIFMDRLYKIASTRLNQLLNDKGDNKNTELDISVYVNGIIKLYVGYFRDEINVSLDEINDYLKHLFTVIFDIKK